VLVHTVAESQRHAGHADIVRELVDGSAGYLPDGDLLPDGDRRWWTERRARLERIARDADRADQASTAEAGRTR
jgi:hypothetical protein